MCGIAGSLAPRGARADHGRVEALLQAMRARGPDGEGVWRSEDGRVCFGHRRLAVIDPDERAAQPMVSGDGRYVLTFNGEIYNHATLRKELAAAGVALRTTSDSEVLLELFAREGTASLARLRGMFALAIADTRDGTLVLARDPYGIKPLYLTDATTSTLTFASSLRALVSAGVAGTEPEPAAVAAFLALGSVPDPLCWNRGVDMLPAGSIMTIDADGGRRTERLPDVAEAFMAARGRAAVPEADGAIASALRESVAAHLVADIPVGLFLSAGIDSGTLLALMNEVGESAPLAVTLGFDGEAGETAGARDTATAAAVRLDTVVLDQASVAATVPGFLAAMEQPTIDGLNTWLVARAARERGLRVALSGIGGDELFAGYPSFGDIPRWMRVAGALRAFPGAAGLATGLASALIAGFGVSPKLATLTRDGWSLGGAWLARRGLFTPDEVRRLMRPDAFESACARLPGLTEPARFADGVDGDDHLAVAAMESTRYLRHQLLRDADWAGMAHSVEIRTPLVDDRLLRSVLSARGGRPPRPGKAELWQAPARPMPAEQARRPKTGFTVPMRRWLTPPRAGRPAWLDSHWSRSWALQVLVGGFPDALGLMDDRWRSALAPSHEQDGSSRAA